MTRTPTAKNAHFSADRQDRRAACRSPVRRRVAFRFETRRNLINLQKYNGSIKEIGINFALLRNVLLHVTRDTDCSIDRNARLYEEERSNSFELTQNAKQFYAVRIFNISLF